MITADEMLQRPYILSGTVVHNRAIGKKIGFPTANLISDKQLLPFDGVYATAIVYLHNVYPSVTNIGWNPTVGGTTRTVETHILNTGLDLYGSRVSILFFERLREEFCFESTSELSKQIEKDIIKAQKIYSMNEKRVYKFKDL